MYVTKILIFFRKLAKSEQVIIDCWNVWFLLCMATLNIIITSGFYNYMGMKTKLHEKMHCSTFISKRLHITVD